MTACSAFDRKVVGSSPGSALLIAEVIHFRLSGLVVVVLFEMQIDR